MAERDTDDGALHGDEAVEIGNEFALVQVRKVRTRNGERLEIRSPRRNTLIRLDPMELEAISALDPDQVVRLFEEPPAHSH